jgi:hypothetical protein
VSVAEIGKPKNHWCQHAKANRCTIYETRPQSCVRWSCMWLVSDHPDELKPNRSHVVFDILPDVVNTEEGAKGVVQLWVDPGYPDAHRAPAVRRVIEGIGTVEGMPTLARIGARGLLIVPPCLNGGVWLERETVLAKDFTNGDAKHARLMAEAGLYVPPGAP